MPGDEGEIIRPSRRDDLSALGALFEEAFGVSRDPAVWVWKYFENPRGCMSFVCEAGGRLVAHCGGVPVRFRDGEREITALQVGDVMSTPRYPGGLGRGGVFFRTAEAFFAAYCGPSKVPLVYGFPGERHRLVGERLLGYRPVEPVAELRLAARGAARAPEPLREVDLPFFAKVPLTMGALRDPIYLRWRYLAHPLWRYGVVRIRRRILPGTQIAALVREDEERLYVMEIAGRFSRAAAENLADGLASCGREVVLWGSPDHPVGRILLDGGFSLEPRDHQVEIRKFDGRPTPHPGELYYSLGDYDVH